VPEYVLCALCALCGEELQWNDMDFVRSPVVAWSALREPGGDMRAAFDIDAPAVGLGDGIATAFSGVTLTYQFEN
jgi:hypothetical protein